jgi:FkbM family methyltransferase
MSKKSFLKRSMNFILEKSFPDVYYKRKFNYLKSNPSEFEIRFLPILCKTGKTSIDVGAAHGSYTIHMDEYSKDIIAFDPIPDNIKYLKKMIYHNNINAKVEPIALSDKKGISILNMIEKDLGRSTIESTNILEDKNGNKIKQLIIRTKTMDMYDFNNVGCIKIDVEGHEYAVLNGAIETIRNNKPALIIELEERHRMNSISDVNDFLKPLGYNGYFFQNKKLLEIKHFSVSEHQNVKHIGNYTDNYKRKGDYINNFIFLHHEEADSFLENYQAYTDDITFHNNKLLRSEKMVFS